ncbi:diadenylate cyclase, partial [Clostridioides difficile]
ALIIMERETRISDIINTGTIIDAEISRQLLINIFIPNTPLHDGAVVIRDSKVKAAACFLPLTESKDLSKDLGTRHRAGIGVSEVSDCITLIVSEETGGVSIAKAGKLYRDISRERMMNILRSNLKTNTETRSFFKGGIFK